MRYNHFDMLPERAFLKVGGRITLEGGGGGGPSSTQTTGTTYQTNIPEYAQPYVTTMLNATQQQLFNMQDGQITGFNPYRAYGGTYDAQGNQLSYDPSKAVAGFSPLQTQAQTAAANLQTPGQFVPATDLAMQSGYGSLGAANQAAGLQGQALGYGAAGAQYGDVGQMYGAQGAQQAGLAAQQAARQAQMYGRQGAMTGREALGYGAQGAAAGAGATGLGLEASRMAQAQGLGYGAQGAGYGGAAAGLAPAAQGYGQTAADIGAQGLGYGAMGAGYGAQAAGMAGMGYGAGAQFAQQATSPEATRAYMSPYMQNVVDYQKTQALRDYSIGQQLRKAQAVGAGAFGGSRQALVESEAQRNLMSQLGGIEAQGAQQAFQNAQAQQQFGANLGLQGLQAGTAAQQAGMQGAQTGLSGLGMGIQGQQAALSGLGQAGQLYGLGMQGAGVGLSGLQGALAGTAQGLQGYQTGIQGAQAGMQGVSGAQAAANLGLSGVGQQLAAGNLGLAGTAQGIQGAQAGMQGAGVGLTGLQGAIASGQYGLQGLGQAGTAAGQLGSLGTQQLAAQQGVVQTQAQQGATQQALQQQIINQAIQDYANAQQYPLMQLGTMSNMLRGLPMQAASTQQYVAQANPTTQAIGTIGSLGSLYGAFGGYGGQSATGRAEGGILSAKKYAKGGIASYDIGGAVEADLYDMPMERLQKELQSPSAEIRKKAKRIMAEKYVEGKAGGGIIAFARPTEENNQSLVEEPEKEKTAEDVQYAPGIKGGRPAAPAPEKPLDLSLQGMKKMGATQYQDFMKQANRPLSEIVAEEKAMMGPNVAAQKYREAVMSERANAEDEFKRQNWLRAAQIFADWGSQPGNTLVAGMNALKGRIGDVISDREAQRKYYRDIDKTMYELDKADRLEEAGYIEAARKTREKAGEQGFKMFGHLSDIARTESSNAATLQAAQTRAGGGNEKLSALYNARSTAQGKLDSAMKNLPDSVKELAGMNPEGKSEKLQADIAHAKRQVAERTGDIQKEIDQIDATIKQVLSNRGMDTPTGGEGGKGDNPAAPIQNPDGTVTIKSGDKKGTYKPDGKGNYVKVS